MKKQKKPLSPDAAKILEQYRNAGKSAPAAAGGEPGAPDAASPTPKPSSPPPPSAAMKQRSGNRGK